MSRTLPPHAPARVGRYLVEAEIGRGGMGVVYRGRDPDLGRAVAMKALRREGQGGDAALSRLRREARLLAAIDHPGIAAIHDIVETESGPWLVLEYVEGESLAERLARGPLPVAEAVRVCRAVAHALECAHARGVIHRDLKPSNVQLAASGACKVLDFGLGRSLAGAGATASIAISGTPAYMSPEQMRGDVEDGRTDVWAFGCLLYESLTARRPPPDLDALPLDTPRALRDLLARCLRPNPAERAASMTEVRETLDDILAGRGHGAAPLGNLPHETSSFTGRRTELADLAERLGHTRLLTLAGVGGVGKTRLALKLAERVAHRFDDGTWFADLARVSDPALVVPAMAEALGVREEAERPLRSSLLDRLESQALLVVLDNCEHLVAPVAEIVEEILQRAGRVRIVVTTREALGVNGETVHAVGPFGEDDAVALFVERACAVHAAFAPDEAEQRAVRAICRQLDGLALAIELAASRIRVLSVEQIAERLRDRFALLTGGGRRSVARHKTLRAALDWSYDLLTADERIALARLSVCAGGCSLDAAEAVVADDSLPREAVLDVLSTLVDKSLVVAERNGHDVRYRLLESVREYAYEHLSHERSEAERVSDRHLAFYLHVAESSVPALHGSGQDEWLPRLDVENANLRSALDWALAGPRDAHSALRMADALYTFWQLRGHWTEASARLQQALAHAPADAPASLRAHALRALARLTGQQGNPDESRRLLDEALRLSTEAGDRSVASDALNLLGTLAREQGDYERAQDVGERALAIKRELGDAGSIAAVLNELALLARARGDTDAALRDLEESFRLYASVGDRANMAGSLNNQSIVLWMRGDVAAAGEKLLAALAILRALGDRARMAEALNNLGLNALADGDLVAAREHLDESRALSEALGKRRGVGTALVNTGHVELTDGRHAQAAACYREAIAILRETRGPLALAECVEGLGQVAIETARVPHGVRLIAAGDAARRQLSAVMDAYFRSSIDASLARARQSVSQAAYDAFWADGAAWSLDEAVTRALDV